MFRRGIYNWSSTDLKALGHSGIAVPANCTIDGNGSVINITGSDQIFYVFTATDVSRVAVADLTIVGNGVSTGYNAGGYFSVGGKYCSGLAATRRSRFSQKVVRDIQLSYRFQTSQVQVTRIAPYDHRPRKTHPVGNPDTAHHVFQDGILRDKLSNQLMARDGADAGSVQAFRGYTLHRRA
jgi:hypothetical protein